MSNEWWVFIDDSGNEGMNFGSEGVTDYHVLAAVVMHHSNQSQNEVRFDTIRVSTFNSAPEMKSEYVGNNDVRRLGIIAEIAKSDFNLHVRVTDKKRLHGRGFAYPPSFIKYALGELLVRIKNKYKHITVRCDRIKSPRFQKEVKQYLSNGFQDTLFESMDFSFVDSKASIGVQIADIIAGTFLRCCSISPYPERHQLVQLLNSHINRGDYEIFPGKNQRATVEGRQNEMRDRDPILEMLAISQAESFLEGHEASGDPNNLLHVSCVRQLLKNNALGHSESWVSTKRLMQVCETSCGERLTPRAIRAVMGHLRDEGVLVASRRSPGGYKLPIRMSEVIEYLNTQNEKIKPMVRRIQMARNMIASSTEVDILDCPEFGNLKAILPSLGTPTDSM